MNKDIRQLARLRAFVLATACLLPALPAHAQLRISILAAGETADFGISLPADALPDSHVGRGKNDIAAAWLAEPTTRYDHGVLGDYIEAGAVRVLTREGRTLSYVLPDDSVFEDLYARVHDIDADGRDEVLVVHSRQQSGSSLMALGIRDGKLVPVGETEPIGGRHRWLNPVGVADVDNDGKPEVLVVLTPHIGGTLVVYHFADGRFTETGRLAGVSNHRIGSRALGLAAFVDFDGDGILELVLPSQDRGSLRAISLHHGPPLEQTRIALPSPASGDFELRPPYGMVVPLEDGRRALIRWR
jgi:hypothetical protein